MNMSFYQDLEVWVFHEAALLKSFPAHEICYDKNFDQELFYIKR